MQVTLKNITPEIEGIIVEIARASSSRKDKRENKEGLINYLIKHKHWSPFEHGFLTFEIITSKAIAIQLLRHRSNFFQEFSQRYADVSKGFDGDMFEPIELRQQATTNRQSSTKVFNPNIKDYVINNEGDKIDSTAFSLIADILAQSQHLYNKLLESGVAKECARFILPMTTKTRLYVTMNVRSVIHWLDLRDDEHAQKEIQLVAKEVKRLFMEACPIISKARGYDIPDYQYRVIKEIEALDDKTQKLSSFINGESFNNLDVINKELLITQRLQMLDYLNTLRTRLKLFN